MIDHEQNNLNKQDYRLEVTRPVWLPYNDVSHEIVSSLVDHLDYPKSGPKAQRYAVVVASLLKAAQAHVSSANNDLPHYIGIQRRA